MPDVAVCVGGGSNNKRDISSPGSEALSRYERLGILSEQAYLPLLIQCVLLKRDFEAVGTNINNVKKTNE